LLLELALLAGLFLFQPPQPLLLFFVIGHLSRVSSGVSRGGVSGRGFGTGPELALELDLELGARK
jgi:hypothetical protein